MIVKKEVFNNATESKHEVEGLQIKLERRPNNVKIREFLGYILEYAFFAPKFSFKSLTSKTFILVGNYLYFHSLGLWDSNS